VLGHARSLTGQPGGVVGVTESEAGYGTAGLANSPTGATTGVLGRVDSSSQDATGVLGLAVNATEGATYGVQGMAFSPAGTAGAFRNWAGEGATTGVKALVLSAAGTAGIFENPGGGMLLRGIGAGAQELFSVDGSGNVTATAFVGDGSGLFNLPPSSGGDADTLDGLDSTAFARLSASNSFSGTLSAPSFVGTQSIGCTPGPPVMCPIPLRTAFSGTHTGFKGTALIASATGERGTGGLFSASGNEGIAGDFLVSDSSGGKLLRGRTGTSGVFTEVFSVDSEGNVDARAMHAEVGFTMGEQYRYLAIPYQAFRETEAESAWRETQYGLIGDDCWLDYCYFVAPVNLPHGARITQVKAGVRDIASARNITLRLYQEPQDFTARNLLAILTSNGSPGNVILTGDLSHWVNNEASYYYIVASWDLPPEEERIALHYVRIEYRITKPLP
jgi:hypothetical protein